MLVLTQKNYYRIVLTRISWLRNLFCDLRTKNIWFIYVSSKATKLRKFISWATDVEIRQRKYHYEACNSGFCISLLNSPKQWLKVANMAVNSFDQKIKAFFNLWLWLYEQIEAIFGERTLPRNLMKLEQWLIVVKTVMHGGNGGGQGGFYDEWGAYR